MWMGGLFDLTSPRQSYIRSAGHLGWAFPAGLGAYGVWIGLSISLAVYAVLLIWRFHVLTRRGYLPELAQASPVLTPLDRAA